MLSIIRVIVFFFSSHSYATLLIANILLALGNAPFLAAFATFISSYLTYDDHISTIIQLTASVFKVRIILTSHLFHIINFLNLFYIKQYSVYYGLKFIQQSIINN